MTTTQVLVARQGSDSAFTSDGSKIDRRIRIHLNGASAKPVDDFYIAHGPAVAARAWTKGRTMPAMPYMQFYVGDHLAATSDLSTLEQGAYLLLIFNYWQRGGPLPDDDTKLRV
jgi:hypothetical protein